MGTIMCFSTNGSENPTKAVLPFLNANGAVEAGHEPTITLFGDAVVLMKESVANAVVGVDRKSTRLNSSHVVISYAVFCLKKKTMTQQAGCYLV